METNCSHGHQMKTDEGWTCEECFALIDPTHPTSLRTLGTVSLDTELTILVEIDRRLREQAAFDEQLARMKRALDR